MLVTGDPNLFYPYSTASDFRATTGQANWISWQWPRRKAPSGWYQRTRISLIKQLALLVFWERTPTGRHGFNHQSVDPELWRNTISITLSNRSKIDGLFFGHFCKGVFNVNRISGKCFYKFLFTVFKCFLQRGLCIVVQKSDQHTWYPTKIKSEREDKYKYWLIISTLDRFLIPEPYTIASLLRMLLECCTWAYAE